MRNYLEEEDRLLTSDDTKWVNVYLKEKSVEEIEEEINKIKDKSKFAMLIMSLLIAITSIFFCFILFYIMGSF